MQLCGCAPKQHSCQDRHSWLMEATAAGDWLNSFLKTLRAG
jgi:hypothetical protein